MDNRAPVVEATIFFITLDLDEENRKIEINSLRENAFASVAIFQNREQLAGLSARYEIGPDALGFTITSDMVDIVDNMCLNIQRRCHDFINSTEHLYTVIDQFERELNLEICDILGLGLQLNELTNRCYNAAELSFKTIGDNDAHH